jgi:hypothetical protein
MTGAPLTMALKRGRFSFDKASHFAVAVADECHSLAIDRLGVDYLIYPRHDVEIVAVAHIVFVGGLEWDAVAGAAARVGDEYGPALSDEKIGERDNPDPPLLGVLSFDTDRTLTELNWTVQDGTASNLLEQAIQISSDWSGIITKVLR